MYKAEAIDRSIAAGKVVGRGGLEPPTSALERPERCADEGAEIRLAERRAGCYPDEAGRLIR